MRTWAPIVLGIVLAVTVVGILFSNSQEVIVVLPLLEPWKTKLWAAMAASASVGTAATGALLAWPLLRLKLQTRKHTRRIAQLEQEIHGLRTLPIASDAATTQSVQKV